MKVILDMDEIFNSVVPLDEPTLRHELTEAGCSSYYEDPELGATVYTVDKKPKDHLILGIKWVEV